jgi:hypothetical protein
LAFFGARRGALPTAEPTAYRTLAAELGERLK